MYMDKINQNHWKKSSTRLSIRKNLSRHQGSLGRKDGRKELGLMLHLLIMKMKRYSGASTRERFTKEKAFRLKCCNYSYKKRKPLGFKEQGTPKPSYSDKSKCHGPSLLTSCDL